MSLEVESPWQYENINDITGGVNISVRPEEIEKSEFVEITNMYYRNHRLVVDTGYQTFLGTVRGAPRAQFQFFKKSGSSENMLITDDTVYTETNDEWQYVSNGTSTTLTAGAATSATSLTVASIAGFANGDFIGIELDDGSQHQTTVNGTPAGSTINITDAMPSAAAIGNTVLEAVSLNGTGDNQISIAVMSAFDYMVFTNGTDNVMYYDGSSIQDIPNLPSSGNCKCKAVAVYENYLLLIHTIEGGTAYPQRVRWSDTADPTEWAAGNAGYNDLYDSEDFNITALALGPYMIIYKERSIVRMEYVGATDKLFNFDTVVTGEGAVSVDSVVDIGTEHIFMGNANVYRYGGGFDVGPVGDRVWNKLFGRDREINPNEVSKCICIYIEELDEIWLFYPDATATYPNKLARMSLENEAWTFRDLDIAITGYGFYQTNDTLKWNELIGSWLVQTFKWGGAQTKANSPTTILLSSTGSNQAYEYNYVVGTDNGTTITWQFETKDFYNPQNKFRTGFLDIKCKGATLTIEYSIDGGSTWGSWCSDLTLDSNYVRYRKYKQVIADQIRFRCKGTGPGFGMEWYGFRYMPESLV